MSYLEIIKQNLRDERLNRGLSGEMVKVNKNALRSLVSHLERLEREKRIAYNVSKREEHLKKAASKVSLEILTKEKGDSKN